jgi:hypothetical protein
LVIVVVIIVVVIIIISDQALGLFQLQDSFNHFFHLFLDICDFIFCSVCIDKAASEFDFQALVPVLASEVGFCCLGC